MISLIMPPKKQIPDVSNMLTQELGTASNIKSSGNKKSVLTAISSAKESIGI